MASKGTSIKGAKGIYRLGAHIGAGHFGKVYSAQRGDESAPLWAVKVITPDYINETEVRPLHRIECPDQERLKVFEGS
jgi:hypothetical protein